MDPKDERLFKSEAAADPRKGRRPRAVRRPLVGGESEIAAEHPAEASGAALPAAETPKATPSVKEGESDDPKAKREQTAEKPSTGFLLFPKRKESPVHSFTLGIKPSCRAESLRTAETVASLQIDRLVALFPMVVFGTYLFGLRVLTLTALSVLFCYWTEMAAHLVIRRKNRFDLEPAVIGVVIALGLPPAAPLWFPAVAAILATLLFRVLFGGRLCRYASPAAVVLLLLRLVFPAIMSFFTAPGTHISAFGFTAGSVEAAPTVLRAISVGLLPTESLGAAFVGMRPGAIGETSALLLLAAAVYLGARRLFRFTMPFFCLLTVGVLTYFFPTLSAASDVIALRYAGYHMVGSDLLFGLVFLASEPMLTPRSGKSAVVIGIVGGLVTVGVRYYIAPDLGMLLAVMIMGLLARPLDLLLRPAVFGGPRKKKTEKLPHTPAPVA